MRKVLLAFTTVLTAVLTVIAVSSCTSMLDAVLVVSAGLLAITLTVATATAIQEQLNPQLCNHEPEPQGEETAGA